MVAVVIGSGISLLLLLHTIVNSLVLRRPSQPRSIDEPIAILVPCRNEAHNIVPLLQTLQSQSHVTNVEIVLLDDNSSDDTFSLAVQAAGPHTRILRGAELPSNWLGKPFACHQLSTTVPEARVLVFIDADVRLAPTAISQAVATLRDTGLSLISPYPHQIVGSWSERLLQPLLHWSWLATLPLRLAERSTRASLTAANGQFLVVDANAYRSVGGHEAIADRVLDDMDLLKAFKSQGFKGIVIDGSEIADCRMYNNWSEVETGYTKWLWAAFGSAHISAIASIFLALTYLVPAISLTWVGFAGYLAGVLSRMIAAVRTKGNVLESLLHPLSILLLIYLIGRSWWRKWSGTTTWKGRVLSS